MSPTWKASVLPMLSANIASVVLSEAALSQACSLSSGECVPRSPNMKNLTGVSDVGRTKKY